MVPMTEYFSVRRRKLHLGIDEEVDELPKKMVDHDYVEYNNSSITIWCKKLDVRGGKASCCGDANRGVIKRSEISVTNVKVPSFSVANSSFSFTYSQLSSEMHFLSRLLLLESQLHLFNVLDPGWEFSVSILQSSVTIVNGEIHDDYIAVSGVVDFE
ncbi:hypothetical protein Bca52824_039225 [Brassica carinata]|uniref:Uncharacterized protein n=1 Tax=Brassica carinata TaxID=52824 RepID=A0A8X7RQL4_BRACI|nr:hypothetical protein Bca52824_039225 [Brassica carinata]